MIKSVLKQAFCQGYLWLLLLQLYSPIIIIMGNVGTQLNMSTIRIIIWSTQPPK